MSSVAHAAHRPGNLPADATTFVGRRSEVAEVRRLLSDARLVTLTGVGGVGKTRLAVRIAAGMQRAFHDGVWLVDLTRLSDPSMVVQAVLETLQVHDQSSRDPLRILTDYLRDRQVLLVLDNCEHLLQACATVADALLRTAPGLRILATSRQPLNIPDEHTMPVHPLTLPEDGQTSLPGDLSAQSGAVALFVDRAVAVHHDFALTKANQSAVVGICRQLDGIPLAIELAAARLRTLTPEQILERLDDRYRLLTTGPRSAAPRHQTLQALIDWSFERLSSAEQLLWMRTSVFSGSFDLTAAEAICAGDGIKTEDVIDLVAELIDKSILVREESGRVARYRQLDIIREYGRRKLAGLGDEARTRLRHRDYYQRIAARTAVEQFGPNQVEWFGGLTLDYADLRAAMEYCLTTPGEAQNGLRMAADLLFHWVRSYYLIEGRRWLDRMLAADTTPTRARADALWSDSWLAIIQGDTAAAQVMLDEARRLGEHFDSPRILGYVALFSGFAAMYSGDSATALRRYDEARQLHLAAGNQQGLALTFIRLCMGYSFLGDSERAIAMGEECVKLSDAVGDIWCKAYALMAMGIDVWRQGDARRATVIEQESLRMNRSLDARLGIALNLEVLAWVAASVGQFQHSASLLGALQKLKRSTGAPLSGYGHLAGYHEACVNRVRDALGAEGYDAMVLQGANLNLDQAISLALREKEHHARPAPARGEAVHLTRREREIAELVAKGQSNKEIAAALVIAQRTAESHVENILVKLGFTSRAQIAAWVSAHGQAERPNR
ncbi:LuxR C-terminal-related transcriptional regulator [Actinopolymorpha sp. B9G3]|uniref:ATP-binding protein n=1 Tax=Actinopolymorpha sp. B9G3 TaxID=3158970 RepID=UPI0032D92077